MSPKNIKWAYDKMHKDLHAKAKETLDYWLKKKEAKP